MTAQARSWLGWIAVVLMLLASSTASAATGFLSGNSPLAENRLAGGLHQVSLAISAETHRGCGEGSLQDAAGLFVAPKGRLVQPRGCFPADTPVTTQDGLKPIQAVRRSDQVWGYDLISGEWKLRRVVETYEHDYEGDLVALAVEGEIIEATSNHPFWVIEGEGLERRESSEHLPVTPPDAQLPGRWVDAGNLRAGDVLLLKSGRQVTINRLSVRHVRQKVYNFQVEEVHTYAVGNSQVLVHNKPVEYAPMPEGPVGKLTKPNDAWFADRGLDPHQIKTDLVGGSISKYDVFKDQNGNLWVLPKNGRGEPQWYGRWVEE